MGADFSYDPVTAIDEANATGETAEIFADIRQTMSIPLVTSIWRGLAGMGDSLPTVWSLAKPIYASGLAAQGLHRVIERTQLPVPEPLVAPQLSCVGIDAADLQSIRTIIAAYNRSNGMNLLALNALITAPGDEQAIATPSAPAPEWPALPPLMAQPGISADTWLMVRHVNAFGADAGLDANVATLWRHLAHWPGLLALVKAGFASQQAGGAIDTATTQVVELAQIEGARMAYLRPARVVMSDVARETIHGYVRSTSQVVRMVTLGHALARWLALDVH